MAPRISRRSINKSLARWVIASAMALGATGVLAGTADAAVTNISVSLSPTSIVADGGSTTTATATVTDDTTDGSGENITFSQQAPATTTQDKGGGTYTATIRSTTTVGQVTITASDVNAPGVTGSAPLTQTLGPARHIALQLSPTSIVANGSSTSTATATVKDVAGHPVSGETIAFSPQAGPTTDKGNGIYTATITSSTAVGQVTITAFDTSTGGVTPGSAPLTQQQGPATTTTSLIPVANNPVTNQNVALIATVTSSQGDIPPTGAITFENGGRRISGCGALFQSKSQSFTIVCQTSFTASTANLTAVFTPSTTASVTGSTSSPTNLTINKDSTTTSMLTPDPVTAGAQATFAAVIGPAHSGALAPTGSVEFLDNRQPINTCRFQQVRTAFGSSVATCTVSYSKVGAHSIIARYSGDANFSHSSSFPGKAVTFRTHSGLIRGAITATMQWSFFHTPAYTRLLQFIINGVRVGATVSVGCQGRSCPVAKFATVVTKPKPCKRTRRHRCHTTHPGTLNLMRRFHNQHLRVGTQITVEITEPGWIGKFYLFTVRARRAPRISIGCVAPGRTRPGVGC